jgi:hypothetical protein
MCCGKHKSEVGEISWNGNCLKCAEDLLAENIVGIAEKHGYAFARQLRGMERYIAESRAKLRGEPVSDA